eukprot:1292726-Prymnesium_polylepis.1
MCIRDRHAGVVRMDRRTNRPTGLPGLCGAFVWRAHCCEAAAKGMAALARRGLGAGGIGGAGGLMSAMVWREVRRV